MTDRRRHDKGARKDILTVILAISCIPKHSIKLMEEKRGTYRKKCNEMVKEGILKEYKSPASKTHPAIWVQCLEMNEETLNICKQVRGEKAVEIYTKTIINDRYFVSSESTSFSRRWKIMKNAESFIMFYMSGYQIPRGEVVSMNEDDTLNNIYYTSRQAKGIHEDRLQSDLDKNKKVQTTRINGIAIGGNESYTVYNIGRYISDYSESGENKALSYFNRILVNTQRPVISGAILIAENLDIYKSYIQPKNQKQEKRLLGITGIYDNLYALAADRESQKILQMMKVADWQQKVYEEILSEEQRNKRSHLIDCDGYDENTDQHIFIFCVPNIKRLKMFLARASIDGQKGKYLILCYDYQYEFVKQIAGGIVNIKTTRLQAFYEYFLNQYGNAN